MSKTYIYTLSDSSGIRYIGKSDNPAKRLSIHLKESKLKRTKKEKWIFSLKAKGQKPILEILDEVDSYNWSFYECYWISQFKSWEFKLLNGTSGGEGSDGFKGKKLSEESKKKIRDKIKGGKGHVILGEKNGTSKLTSEKVIEIRHKSNNGSSTRNLAKEYNVSKTNISKIIKRKVWTHILNKNHEE